jgi:hypothetical protein
MFTSSSSYALTENHNGAPLAVINETLARLYFPNGDPVGHSLKLPDIENPPADLTSAPGIAGSWLQIVGVVGDSRDAGLRNPVKPAIFVPWTLRMPPSTQILVRLEVPPLGLLDAMALVQIAEVGRVHWSLGELRTSVYPK